MGSIKTMNSVRWWWRIFRSNPIVTLGQIMCSCATFHERLCHFNFSVAHSTPPDETALNQQSSDVQSINVTWHRSINKLWSRFVAPIDGYPSDCCSHICKLDYSDLIFEVGFSQLLSKSEKNARKITENVCSSRAQTCWLLNRFGYFQATTSKPKCFCALTIWRLIIRSQRIVWWKRTCLRSNAEISSAQKIWIISLP